MKRFHVHLNVADLAASIGFYSRLFGAEPSRVESDYAKWMLDDPRVNFAISTRGAEPGIDHLGFQADSDAELAELRDRAAVADLPVQDEGLTTCCYARSDKHWVTDPQGIAWEQFRTLDSIPVFRETGATAAAVPAQPAPAAAMATSAAESASPAPADSACCAPKAPRGRPVAIAVRAEGKCC